MTKKAIIVAAGRGRRLADNTEAIPKCMVPVAGRPILHWQLEALTSVGVEEIVIVRGYLGNRIDPGATAVRFVDNPDWADNNILASLFYARDEFAGGFYFSYCDIVYTRIATDRLAKAASQSEVSLIVDRDWAKAYEGRTLHPVSEAELTLVDDMPPIPRVIRVGKGAVPPAEAVGEFIGLAHFSARGASALAAAWEGAISRGLHEPFGRAKTLRQAYLTDGLNAMIEAGSTIAPIYIEGQWREIDTPQDLAAVEAAYPDWSR